ncbi:hypothetical protein [Streptomyces tubercidicus]|uniref:Uncharacterized protein n=1 Tax=Streptomyces tubercidicus TaxID=47759 RepID=A0A640URJ2_9ACTN|nr:hypothetical protein [Streptomyces tubercidicus]WAU12612.1 hypothetical protein STRTU_002988 [Streptomyces tubercidicus]GFE38080.1 hypothetical protein Stube_27530 [Streptomyces tubercidicus]
MDTTPWFIFAVFMTRKDAEGRGSVVVRVVRMLDEECWEPRVGPPDGAWGVFRTMAARYGTG